MWNVTFSTKINLTMGRLEQTTFIRIYCSKNTVSLFNSYKCIPLSYHYDSNYNELSPTNEGPYKSIFWFWTWNNFRPCFHKSYHINVYLLTLKIYNIGLLILIRLDLYVLLLKNICSIDLCVWIAGIFKTDFYGSLSQGLNDTDKLDRSRPLGRFPKVMEFYWGIIATGEMWGVYGAINTRCKNWICD